MALAADDALDDIQTIVAHATTGDAAAAARLIEHIAPVVRARITRALIRRRPSARGRRLDAELDDLTQDTLARLFRDRGRALRAWDPTRGLGFLGFVGLVAEREVGRAMRTRKLNPWTEEPTAFEVLARLMDQASSPAIRFEARDELRHVIAQVRARLTGDGRRYFDLLLLEQRSIGAVASQTGATTDALYAWRTRLTRLAREVRHELETATGLRTPTRHAETARRAESATVPRPGTTPADATRHGDRRDEERRRPD